MRKVLLLAESLAVHLAAALEPAKAGMSAVKWAAWMAAKKAVRWANSKAATKADKLAYSSAENSETRRVARWVGWTADSSAELMDSLLVDCSAPSWAAYSVDLMELSTVANSVAAWACHWAETKASCLAVHLAVELAAQSVSAKVVCWAATMVVTRASCLDWSSAARLVARTACWKVVRWVERSAASRGGYLAA